MPLPTLVKERLINRDNLDISTKKQNEYRARKYVKSIFEDLKEILWLLNTLPETQTSKLVTYSDADTLFELTEKVSEILGPAPVTEPPDDKDVRVVTRHFNVELPNPYPGKKSATASVKLTYKPTDEEIKFYNRFSGHIKTLNEFFKDEDPHRYSPGQFKLEILKPLRASKKDVQAETESVVGFGNLDIKTALSQFKNADETILKNEEQK